MKYKFTKGDRIGYHSKFLRNIAVHSGPMPERRGTFISFETFGGMVDNYARVRWDDESEMLASGGQFDDPEYSALVREKGSLIHAANIQKMNR